MIRQVVGWVLLAAALALLTFALCWRAEGGRWMRVETPSMGTVAPVGTLLWVKPAPFDSLSPGDFITFHPPGQPGRTYSHLVSLLNPDGTLTTQGVIPAADPWRLGPNDVVGTVRMRWWGVGWLVAAAPILLVGGCTVMALRAMVRRVWRAPLTLVLGSIVVMVAVVWWHPFVGADRLAFGPQPGGGVSATYVGTGLLPVRVSTEGAESVTLRAGEVGTIRTQTEVDEGLTLVRLSPAVPWWWWAALVLACFVPAVTRLVTGDTAPVAPSGSGHRGPSHRRVLESPGVESHHRSARAAR